MTFKTVEIKREEDSEWENAYLIEVGDNSIFLDASLNTILTGPGKDNRRVYDHHGCSGCSVELNSYVGLPEMGSITVEEIKSYGITDKQQIEFVQQEYARYPKGKFPNPICALH